MPVDPNGLFPGWHLAQINVSRLRAPLTDPRMARFVAQLDDINRVAEASDGFVWRLKDDTGAASSYIRFSEDGLTIVNMSVWRSIGSLHRYVYRSEHATVYRDRLQWFEPPAAPSLALWWIRAGTRPTLADGRRRLDLLASFGPTPSAFTFRQPFEPELARIDGDHFLEVPEEDSSISE